MTITSSTLTTLVPLPPVIISLIMDYFPPGGLYVPTFEAFYNTYKNSSPQERAFIQECMIEKISSMHRFKAGPRFITIRDDEIIIEPSEAIIKNRTVVLNSSGGKFIEISDGGMYPGTEKIEMGFSYNELQDYKLDAVGTRWYGRFGDNAEEVDKHKCLTAVKDLKEQIKIQEQGRTSMLVLFANYFPLMQEPKLKSVPEKKDNGPQVVVDTSSPVIMSRSRFNTIGQSSDNTFFSPSNPSPKEPKCPKPDNTKCSIS